MNKRFIIGLFLLLVLSTYNIQNDFNFFSKFKIKKIVIENNIIIKDDQIKTKLSFLYKKNLFFLTTKEIEKKLDEIDFIKSYKIKKVYPSTIKFHIIEKKPIAILQYKKKKNYYTDDGETINFLDIKEFKNLPIIFGKKENFKLFYDNLQSINFPIDEIKTFYLFDSKRWDLITKKNQTVKLPIKNYLLSLSNFLNIKDKRIFEKYKIFDYRIKDQLILK